MTIEREGILHRLWHLWCDVLWRPWRLACVLTGGCDDDSYGNCAVCDRRLEAAASLWRLAVLYGTVALLICALAPFVLAEWLSFDSVEGET